MSDDVVVVGSGAAALSAALSAAVRGARVTVLERTDLFGGTSAISGGGMWLPGNGLDPDFADSADDARRYVRHLTLGLTDGRVIDRYVREAPGIPAFLSAHTVLSFWTQIGRPDYHADFDGGSLTSRTVFPDTFEVALLRDLKTRLRRPHWPGGIPPLRHDELQQFAARGDPDGWKRLVEERMAKGIVLRGCALVAVARNSISLFTAVGGCESTLPTCALCRGIGRPARRACSCHLGASQLDRRLNGQAAGIFTVGIRDWDASSPPMRARRCGLTRLLLDEPRDVIELMNLELTVSWVPG